HQFGAGGGRGDHLVSGIGQHQAQALAKQRGVVGDHDAHGITASTRVPPPRGERTVRCPSREATRSASPDSPCPVVNSAPPTPSSSIRTRAAPPDSATRATSTRACCAPECLAALVRASETT